jgi:hypothetical protein
MKKFFKTIFCYFGFHKKHTITRKGVVNCVGFTIEITECKHCKKFYKIK